MIYFAADYLDENFRISITPLAHAQYSVGTEENMYESPLPKRIEAQIFFSLFCYFLQYNETLSADIQTIVPKQSAPPLHASKGNTSVPFL